MIKKLRCLNHEIVSEIKRLESLSCQFDQTSLKLELDYKLSHQTSIRGSSNEFLYYDGHKLIAYLGISSFGSSDLEVNGMVDPDYRKQGVFTKLFHEVVLEWRARGCPKMLLLTDHKSESGIRFIESLECHYAFSENEMYLEPLQDAGKSGVVLRLAQKSDGLEIAEQNKIYFEDVHSESKELVLIDPEEEAKNGFYIFMAYHQEELVGKVNLVVEKETGSIYGLGVKPEYRRRGYGRAILLASLNYFFDHQCDRVMLQVVTDNKGALDLYINVGFETRSIMDYYTMESSNE